MNSKPPNDGRDPRLTRLLEMIVELNEKASLAEIDKLLVEGVDPKTLLACCMEGMRRVGDAFEKGLYFIAALIMAGEIMRLATERLSPHLSEQPSGNSGGTVMVGTIQGDIHDLGKNLFSLLLKCHHFKVVDLGVDVAKEVFLERARALKPDIIGISCVLTNSLDNLKEAVFLLKQELPKPQASILVGGTCIDRRMADYLGPVIWAQDAAKGLNICKQQLIAKARRKEVTCS